ncbi:beclin 1-associated autophagy-related key regulator [Caerostris extrusa]|uniref:Beclin 1-associated autophagy-related key regulator n=1 Tax=Caerostris extrusa TaxID=172846 RepID=A0AAV4XBJ8_CAEEX|nr:beclin 1-associated autophagy-related key regulator [Caerostris extrusa]
MASSSDEGLDESIPEMIYQCISYPDAHNHKREDSYLKCKFCNQCKKKFYCDDCIRDGNFTHSKNFLESFSDKKRKKYEQDMVIQDLIKSMFEIIYAKKAKVENVKLAIDKCKEKIKYLENKIKIEDLKGRKNKLIKKQERFSEKIPEFKKHAEQVEDHLQCKTSNLKSKQCHLESLIQKRTNELVTFIFPIFQVPSFDKDLASSDRVKKAELQEAQTFTYVEGNWTYNNPRDNVYSIIEPYLITSDYSPYTYWNEKMAFPSSTSNIPHEDSDLYNSAYITSAALAYEAQLVSVMTSFMNCHVRNRTSFNDFYKFETVEQFAVAVAKLNTHILNLCIARQVDLTKMCPNGTISNLLVLLDFKSNENGSIRAITSEEREDLISSLEEPGVDFLPFNDSDDDTNDDIEDEFVYVPDDEVPFSEPIPVSVPEPVPIHTSLLSSLWKAATGQK